ncbi:unnamed protein product [Amoebophrya sp. A120]|nr:unnamed protein product [Amoebophrya sp. A120]|eukprot:GSA120T00008566001.1
MAVGFFTVLGWICWTIVFAVGVVAIVLDKDEKPKEPHTLGKVDGKTGKNHKHKKNIAKTTDDDQDEEYYSEEVHPDGSFVEQRPAWPRLPFRGRGPRGSQVAPDQGHADNAAQPAGEPARAQSRLAGLRDRAARFAGRGGRSDEVQPFYQQLDGETDNQFRARVARLEAENLPPGAQQRVEEALRRQEAFDDTTDGIYVEERAADDRDVLRQSLLP